MSSSINKQQSKAVHTIKGPLLIFAGAGTGKTRVITYRIINMLKCGINPESILAVTFTNKASTEMRERVITLAGKDISSKITISTFHSLGALILRKYITKLGYRQNFSIYDTSECSSLIRKIIKEEIPDLDTDITPKDILYQLSRFRLSQFSNTNMYLQIPDRILKFILKHFRQYLKNCNAVSFDDLIYMPLELLKDSEVLSYYQEKFKYIMIDEFQDTNGPQYELIKKLANKYQNLCVVGDDDQSIYKFRGSDFSYILNFKRNFANTKTIKLEENYRSTKVILDAAFAVVKHNLQREEKKLWSSSKSSELITLIKGVNEPEEAKKLISFISQQKLMSKFNWKDCAILYRTNAQSRILEEELIAKRIPYKIIGGTKFFERKEVKDIIAYLRVINNPQDETALYRIINIPARGIGQTTIKKINSFCLNKNCNFFKGVSNINQIEDITVSAKKSIVNFIELIKRYQLASKNETQLSKMIKCLIEEINYKVEIRKHYSKTSDIEEKFSNCLGIVFSATDYEKDKSNKISLSAFLERISLMTDNDSDNEKDKFESSNMIKLMTLHNSKGLEFPLVSITGLNETILPHERSMQTNDNIEEERRLMYVGITRAQKKLVLSYSLQKSSYGKPVKLLPSRFLDEIPDNLIDDFSKPVTKNEMDDLFSTIKAKLA